MHVQAHVVAGDATGVYGAAYAQNRLVRKPGSGTAVIKGSQTMATDTETHTAMNLTWARSGTNVLQLLATGVAGQTTTWRAQIKLITGTRSAEHNGSPALE